MTTRRAMLLLGLAPLAGTAARAQPSATTTLVVPVEPGGGIDAMARLVALHWNLDGQSTTIVVNRAGASGNIGTASVARSRPDGHTLLVTGVSHITSPMLHGSAGYEPFDDFIPVARLGTTPNVVVVSEALKGMSMAQVLQDARSRTGGLSFGSAGFGHSSHIAAEIFMAATGVKWLHVPYKGNGPALRGLMAGEIQVLFLSATSVAAAVATGKVHPLAAGHRERLPELPGTPTLSELGVAGAEFTQWYGLFAPRGTPPEVVRDLSARAVKAIRSPALSAQLKAMSVEPDALEQEPFERFLLAEQRRLDAWMKRERVERPQK
jgi:tripartite-type tricarboxylate transporter receptor subunit TctC